MVRNFVDLEEKENKKERANNNNNIKNCCSFTTIYQRKQPRSEKVVAQTSWYPIYSCPDNFNIDTFWDPIITLIQEQKRWLSSFQNKTFIYLDSNLKATYFIAKVEPSIFIVAVVTQGNNEVQARVEGFFDKITQKLRNWTLFPQVEQ